MSEIPEEVMKEIILRLPVKSILKFRCVCHSWLSLIDSPFFIKTHLSYANANANATPKIILNNPSCSLYYLDLNTLNSTVLELNYPPKTSNLPTLIVGSCNGILLSFHSLFDWDVALQNPSTKSFRKIPSSDCEWPGNENVGRSQKIVYGLGYDSLTDDVKVVRNAQFLADFGKVFYSLADVYSLKKNSWRRVDPFPYFVKNVAADGVFVGGAMHWVVSTSVGDLSQLIGAFDLSIEEYRLVQQPVYRSGDFKLNVYVLGECLGAGYCYPSMGCVDFWVMKEYGEVESWSKVCSVRVADVGVNFLGYLTPLVYSECGKKVLMDSNLKTLFWYDLDKKSVEFVEVGGCQIPEMFNSIVLVESLVKLSFHGTRDVERGAQKNDEKSNKRREKRDHFLSTGFKLKL